MGSGEAFPLARSCQASMQLHFVPSCDRSRVVAAEGCLLTFQSAATGAGWARQIGR